MSVDDELKNFEILGELTKILPPGSVCESGHAHFTALLDISIDVEVMINRDVASIKEAFAAARDRFSEKMNLILEKLNKFEVENGPGTKVEGKGSENSCGAPPSWAGEKVH